MCCSEYGNDSSDSINVGGSFKELREYFLKTDYCVKFVSSLYVGIPFYKRKTKSRTRKNI